MPKFAVQCRDPNGSLFKLNVEAPSALEARRKAESDGHQVEWVGDQPLPQGSRGIDRRAGQELATTAFWLSALGLLIAPLAIAGVILGAVAKERSGGKHGGGAVGLGFLVLFLWAAAIAVAVLFR
jgi:hypothetical protein